MLTLFVIISWKYFGFHMILMLAGLQGIPHELEEAALIDGAGRWQAFRYVTLPLLGPTLRVSVFLSMIGALQLFDMVWVMTEGGPLNASNTMAILDVQGRLHEQQMGYGSALAVILFLFGLVVALAYQRFVLRRDIEGAITATTGEPMATTAPATTAPASRSRARATGRLARPRLGHASRYVDPASSSRRRSSIPIAVRGPRRVQDQRPARGDPAAVLPDPWVFDELHRRPVRRTRATFWRELRNSLVVAVDRGHGDRRSSRRSPRSSSPGSRSAAGRRCYTLFVFGLLFPSAVAILPLYILVRELGLSGNLARRGAARRRPSRCR